MQEAGSEFWKGWPSEITIDRTADNETVEHIEEPRPIKAGRIANLAKLPNSALNGTAATRSRCVKLDRTK
jgi:hypothetical protein